MSAVSKQRISAVKVGILSLTSLSLLFGALIWLRGGSRFAHGQEYDVIFDDVNGLRENAIVQMMGVRVGSIDEIHPYYDKDYKKYRVQVRFSINPDLHLTIARGAHISIEQSGIIGEQFLEITPPQPRQVLLTTFNQPIQPLNRDIPVKFLYEKGYLQVGKVEKVVITQDNGLYHVRLTYRITLPGATMPDDPVFELALDPNGVYSLRVLPRTPVLTPAPPKELAFTVEEPLRMKRFIEIQLESAEALKLTNDKINQLLSDETIASLNNTLKNTEMITAQANGILASADSLFKSTQQDLNRLVTVSEQLTESVTEVSRNVNDILKDPKIKGDMTSTVASLRESSTALRELLHDPALHQAITSTRDASQNTAALVNTLQETIKNSQVDTRGAHIVEQLDSSLTQLNGILNALESDTGGATQNDPKLRGIIEDTRQTAKNLRALSEKLNGHFALFKLLF